MLKLGLCQMQVVQGDRAQNHRIANEMIAEAAQLGAEVVVLPEMWSCGYDFDRLDEHKETLTGPSVTLLQSAAKRFGIWLVGGSLPIADADGVYNTSVVLAPNGEIVHTYRKIHLIGLMREDRFLRAGREAETFDIGEVPAAVLICYDLRFPELARRYARRGARVLFIPAEWPEIRQSHWQTLVRARAIENQAYVVAVNMTGRNTDDVFAGGSLVVNPWGEVLTEASRQAQVLRVDLNLNVVKDVRSRMSVLQDIRPDCY